MLKNYNINLYVIIVTLYILLISAGKVLAIKNVIATTHKSEQ
jgi:hypothetical protein